MDLFVEIDDSEFELPNLESATITEKGISVKRPDNRSNTSFSGDVKRVTIIRQEMEYFDGWIRWRPCPECGSTTFEQTEKITVNGTEDGNYSGEDNDMREKIECAECGEVLEDY